MPIVDATHAPTVPQERCERLRDAVLAAAGTTSVGVYLSLPVAAWAQGGD